MKIPPAYLDTWTTDKQSQVAPQPGYFGAEASTHIRRDISQIYNSEKIKIPSPLSLSVSCTCQRGRLFSRRIFFFQWCFLFLLLVSRRNRRPISTESPLLLHFAEGAVAAFAYDEGGRGGAGAELHPEKEQKPAYVHARKNSCVFTTGLIIVTTVSTVFFNQSIIPFIF